MASDTVALDPALLRRALALSTASIHEAQDRTGALPSAIKPVAPTMRLAGRAFTVACPAGHNLNIHRAIIQAAPGDVLVVSTGDGWEYGYWGEILSRAAQARGLAGLVIDGGVRDADAIETIGLPVFSRPLCIRGTGKAEGGALNRPLQIGDVVIRPGDVVIGDRDGVVMTPADRLAAVIDASEAREEKERRILDRLAAGETTLGIYGFA